MPAITLGLAEIEKRLRALRRRLNLVKLQHGVYVSASAIILAATGLIILGLRGSPGTFRVAAWSAAALSLGAIWGCALFLHWHWLDAQATAHLVDRRARLTDRLATIVDLRKRSRPSRLAPVLIAQTLGLGARWQPRQIAPRAVPRSLFLLLASLLALASTAFIARREATTATAPHAAAVAVTAGGGTPALNPPQAGAPDFTISAQAGSGSGLQQSGDFQFAGRPEPGPGSVNEPSDRSVPRPVDRSLASLPDRLQETIRRAFRGQATHEPRELAARSGGGDQGGGDREGKANPDSRGGKPDGGKAGPRPQGPQEASGRRQQGKPGQPKSGEQPRQPDPAASGKASEGSAPGAGEGTSPGGLMAQKGTTGLAASADAPKTFKLTITSFLRAVDQKGSPPGQPGAAGRAGRGPGTGSAAALNERQLSDDALRKAEIPREYEEIVRRVYSARADR
jgi:hypothetical protein